MVGASGKIYSFEPDHTNYEMLTRNIKEQGAANVTPIQKGLSGKTGETLFRHGEGLAAQIASGPRKGGTPVEVLSYADACALAGGEPDFVKMDVEGAEIEIIRAALPHLKQSRTRFAIASYHIVDGQPSSIALEELFRSIGYKVETGNPEHQTTWAWRE
jgi:FkbM family methyltransferase